MKHSPFVFAVRPIVLALNLAWVSHAAWALPATDSPYYTDAQSSFVEDATSRGIGQVNMIACFMNSMRPADLVNQSHYVALVDELKCDPNSRSSASNQGASGGAQAPQYTRAIVNSTRASNADPMLASIWVSSEMGPNTAGTIFLKLNASSAPSSDNPYGVFRLDFCGKEVSAAAAAACLMKGYLDASATGLQFFQNEGNGSNGTVTQLALTQGSGGSTGQGRLAQAETSSNITTTSAFTFAYNSTHYRRSDTDTNSDLCFSRLEADAKKSVWRYGLYNADGTRLEINSGFPVRWTDTGTGQSYQGQIGYYGLWLEDNKAAVIPDGATLVKQNFGSNAPTESYLLSKARGRLTKYTRQTTTLDRVANVRMTVGMNIASVWQQVEIYWDGTLGQFVKSGVMTCGGSGCNIQSVDPVQPIANATWATQGGIFGWSQSLGGEVFIGNVGNLANPTAVDVAYRVQSLVYPNDFPAELKCLGECANVSTMTNYFTDQMGATSPYLSNTLNVQFDPAGVAAGNLVSYVQDGSSGELKVSGDSAALVISNANWLSAKPMYQFGFRLGKLFDAANAASVLCDGSFTQYCGSKLNDLPVYYTWETGTQSFNQFFALRTASGNCAGSNDAYCRFDPPLSVTFSVPNDTVAYGEYAGRDVILQYGGYGNLWGVPGLCVNRLTNAPADCSAGGQNIRFVPAFVIPFDTTQGVVRNGSTSYYVKWLDREMRFSQVGAGNCSALTLPSSGLTLPDATGFQSPGESSSANYIGALPTVTAAPRVIAGEVKY